MATGHNRDAISQFKFKLCLSFLSYFDVFTKYTQEDKHQDLLAGYNYLYILLRNRESSAVNSIINQISLPSLVVQITLSDRESTTRYS